MADVTISVRHDKYYDGTEAETRYPDLYPGASGLAVFPVRIETSGDVLHNYYHIFEGDLSDESAYPYEEVVAQLMDDSYYESAMYFYLKYAPGTRSWRFRRIRTGISVRCSARWFHFLPTESRRWRKSVSVWALRPGRLLLTETCRFQGSRLWRTCSRSSGPEGLCSVRSRTVTESLLSADRSRKRMTCKNPAAARSLQRDFIYAVMPGIRSSI